MKQKSKILWQKPIILGLFLPVIMVVVTIEMLNVSIASAKTLPINPHRPANQAALTPLNPHTPFLLQPSSLITYYLPIIHKSDLVYSDNFENSNSGWLKVGDQNCTSKYDAGRYVLTINNDKECFRPAPANAERTFGAFQALVYQSGEGQGDARVGLYINGKGGDNYYLFVIRPNINNCSNGGGYEFTRKRKDSNGNVTVTTLASSNCNPNVKRGYGSGFASTLRVSHTSDRRIILTINNVQVANFFEDPTKELTGIGTGVYSRAVSDKNTVTKYDDFSVFRP
jgi:hypothetical protein